MRSNLIITLFGAYALSMSTLTAKGLCVGFSSGDAIHLDYCRESTKQKCYDDNNQTMDYNATDAMFSGNNFFEYIENKSCKDIKIQTARDAEERLSLQWNNWIYSNTLESGDSVYIYRKDSDQTTSVNIHRTPDFKSKIEFIAKHGQKVKILKKGKEQTYKEMQSYWFEIKIGDRSGWIWGEYLHPDPLMEEEYYQKLVEQE